MNLTLKELDQILEEIHPIEYDCGSDSISRFVISHDITPFIYIHSEVVVVSSPLPSVPIQDGARVLFKRRASRQLSFEFTAIWYEGEDISTDLQKKLIEENLSTKIILK